MPTTRQLDCALATYSFAVTGVNPATSATDLWVLTPNGAKTTKIRYVEVSGNAASAAQRAVQLLRRSTANTGGTSTSPSISPADPATDGATSATITQYSVNATGLGTLANTHDAATFVAVAGTSTLQDRAIFNYEQFSDKPITLIPSVAAAFFAVNLALIATVNTDKLDLSLWWTEN